MMILQKRGDFKNGDTHTDSSGSWTYQNGVWYDNTGNDNNIIEEIVITSNQNNSNNLYNGISTIQCHHNTSTPNGEKNRFIRRVRGTKYLWCK